MSCSHGSSIAWIISIPLDVFNVKKQKTKITTKIRALNGYKLMATLHYEALCRSRSGRQDRDEPAVLLKSPGIRKYPHCQRQNSMFRHSSKFVA